MDTTLLHQRYVTTRFPQEGFWSLSHSISEQFFFFFPYLKDKQFLLILLFSPTELSMLWLEETVATFKGGIIKARLKYLAVSDPNSGQC
jgi:hypothetical protein